MKDDMTTSNVQPEGQEIPSAEDVDCDALEQVVSSEIQKAVGWSPGEMAKRARDTVDTVDMADANGLDTVVQIVFDDDFGGGAQQFVLGQLKSAVDDERVIGLSTAFLEAGVMNNWASCLNWPAAWRERPLMPVLAYVSAQPLIEDLKSSPYPYLFRGGLVVVFVGKRSSANNLTDRIRQVVDEDMGLTLDDDKTRVVSLSKWRRDVVERDEQDSDQSPIITP